MSTSWRNDPFSIKTNPQRVQRLYPNPWPAIIYPSSVFIPCYPALSICPSSTFMSVALPEHYTTFGFLDKLFSPPALIWDFNLRGSKGNAHQCLQPQATQLLQLLWVYIFMSLLHTLPEPACGSQEGILFGLSHSLFLLSTHIHSLVVFAGWSNNWYWFLSHFVLVIVMS